MSKDELEKENAELRKAIEEANAFVDWILQDGNMYRHSSVRRKAQALKGRGERR